MWMIEYSAQGIGKTWIAIVFCRMNGYLNLRNLRNKLVSKVEKSEEQIGVNSQEIWGTNWYLK